VRDAWRKTGGTDDRMTRWVVDHPRAKEHGLAHGRGTVADACAGRLQPMSRYWRMKASRRRAVRIREERFCDGRREPCTRLTGPSGRSLTRQHDSSLKENTLLAGLRGTSISSHRRRRPIRRAVAEMGLVQPGGETVVLRQVPKIVIPQGASKSSESALRWLLSTPCAEANAIC